MNINKIKKQSLKWDIHLCETKHKKNLEELEEVINEFEELKTRGFFEDQEYQVSRCNQRIKDCLARIDELEKERESLNLKLTQLKENAPVII